MDVFLIVYFVLVIISLFCKKDNREDYLSIESTTSIRGISAIGIVLCHMAAQTSGGLVFGYFNASAYLIVTIFMFFSGYGLLVQYQKRKGDYLNGFIKQRLLYIIIIYLLDVGFYTIGGMLLGQKYSLKQIFRSVFVGGIAINSWYLMVIIVLYAIFFVAFKNRLLKTVPQKIILVSVLVTIYAITCVYRNKPPFYYLSDFGFILGLIWAYKKEKIDAILEKKYYLVLICAALLFALFYGTPILTDNYFSSDIYLVLRGVSKEIAAVLFAAVIITLNYKFKINWALWKWIGGVSLEIYLLHGFVYMFLRSDIIYLKNEIIWTLLTIAISITIAYPVSFMNRQIAKMLKKRRRTETT